MRRSIAAAVARRRLGVPSRAVFFSGWSGYTSDLNSRNLPAARGEQWVVKTAEEFRGDIAAISDVQAIFDKFETLEQTQQQWETLLVRLADIDPRWACKYLDLMAHNGCKWPSPAVLSHLCDRCRTDDATWQLYEDAVRGRPPWLYPWFERYLFWFAVIATWCGMYAAAHVDVVWGRLVGP